MHLVEFLWIKRSDIFPQHMKTIHRECYILFSHQTVILYQVIVSLSKHFGSKINGKLNYFQ